MKALKERLSELSSQLEIMQGREKGNLKDLFGKDVVIRDYAFMKDDKDGYAVFIIDEDNEHFFFGGKVLTEALETLEAEGYHNEINQVGIRIVLNTKRSKNNREYTTVEYI